MYYFFKLIITFVLLNAFNLNGQNLNYLKTCVKEQHCFDTRVADNVFQRAKGLMGETNLPRSEACYLYFHLKGNQAFG